MHQHPRGCEVLPLPTQLFQPVLVGAFGILGQLLLQVDPVGQALVGDLQLQPVQAHEDIQGDFADALVGVGHAPGKDHADDFGDGVGVFVTHADAQGQPAGRSCR